MMSIGPVALAQGAGSAATLVSTSSAGQTQLPEGIPSGLLLNTQNDPYLFWADMTAGLLYLLERQKSGLYRPSQTISMSIGKEGYGKELEGDQKTPIGVYNITSWLDDKALDDFYGSGAYPINYPNTWDKRNGRTGYGIWLHGLPKTVEWRPLLDSNGCIVIDNDTLANLAPQVDIGKTLFVLSENMDWQASANTEYKNAIIKAVDSWRESWEANNIDRYLGHYHPDFNDFRRDFNQWSQYKTRVNGAKSYIRVELSEVSAFQYPGEDNLIYSRFYQNYESSNYNWSGWKQLLWQRDSSGHWKIIYEGNG